MPYKITYEVNFLTILNVLIILFLAIIVTILISFITHISQALFIYIRIGIVVTLSIIAGYLLWMDFFI